MTAPATRSRRVRALACALALAAAPALAQEVQAPAVVVAEAEAVMAAQTAAQLTAFPVAEGQRFAQGEVLVTFECALPRASLAAAEFERTAARADATSKTALLNRGGIGRTEVAIARARLGAAEAELAGALALVERCEIRAPFAGTMVAHLVNAFETVEIAEDVIRVISNAPVEVDVIAPSAWLRWIKPGQMGQMTVEETGQAYRIEVTRLSAVVDAVSRSIKITARFLNAPEGVRPGMSGVVRMEATGG